MTIVMPSVANLWRLKGKAVTAFAGDLQERRNATFSTLLAVRHLNLALTLLPSQLQLNVERKGHPFTCGWICMAMQMFSGVSGPLLDTFSNGVELGPLSGRTGVPGS